MAKQLDRYYACERKSVYEDPDDAIRQAARRTNATGERIVAYACRFCTGYHIGHFRPELPFLDPVKLRSQNRRRDESIARRKRYGRHAGVVAV